MFTLCSAKETSGTLAAGRQHLTDRSNILSIKNTLDWFGFYDTKKKCVKKKRKKEEKLRALPPDGARAVQMREN